MALALYSGRGMNTPFEQRCLLATNVLYSGTSIFQSPVSQMFRCRYNKLALNLFFIYIRIKDYIYICWSSAYLAGAALLLAVASTVGLG